MDARGEAERIVGVLTDERDASVPQRHEVSCRHAPAVDVIGDDHVNVLAPRVDEDHRHAGICEAHEVGRSGWKRQHQQPVGPVSSRQRGEVLISVDG